MDILPGRVPPCRSLEDLWDFWNMPRKGTRDNYYTLSIPRNFLGMLPDTGKERLHELYGSIRIPSQKWLQWEGHFKSHLMGYFETPGSVWQLKSLEGWRCSSYFPWDHQHVTEVSHVIGWLQWFRLSCVSRCVICRCGLTSVRLVHLPRNSDMSTTSVWHLHTFLLVCFGDF